MHLYMKPRRDRFVSKSLTARCRLPLVIGIVLLVTASTAIRLANAQSPDTAMPPSTPDARPLQIDRGAAALWQTLLKLRTRASLLIVVAHPDDEDSGMLTLETRGHGARTMMLTLNRGEGGQNVMSDDFEDALGLGANPGTAFRRPLFRRAAIFQPRRRLWVLENTGGGLVFVGPRPRSCRRGSSRAYDAATGGHIGFCGWPDGWTWASSGRGANGAGSLCGRRRSQYVPGSDSRRIAAVVADENVCARPYECGHSKGNPRLGHRQVLSGALLRLHSQEWSDGLPSVDVEIPEGTYDPVLGASYLQVAREGLALQKSQNGGGAIPYAGPVSVPYHRYASQVPASGKESSFFDGIDVSLAGIAGLAQGQPVFLKDGLSQIDALVGKAISAFSLDHPEKVAPSLAQGLQETNALVAQVSASQLSEDAKYNVLHELPIKQDQFQQAIAESLGFSLEATVAPKKEPQRDNFFNAGPTESFAYAVPGQDFDVKVHLDNPAAGALKIDRIWLQTPAGETWTVTPETPVPASLPAGQQLDQKFDVRIPDNAQATRPYFTRPNDEQPYYDIMDERYVTLPLPPYPVTAWVEFDYEGAVVRAGQSVQTVRRQNGFGTVFNPLMVTPAVSVRIAPKAGITTLGSKSFAVSAIDSHRSRKRERRARCGSSCRRVGARNRPPHLLRCSGQARNRTSPSRFFQISWSRRHTQSPPWPNSTVTQYREGFTTVGYPGVAPLQPLYARHVPDLRGRLQDCAGIARWLCHRHGRRGARRLWPASASKLNF